MSKQEYKAPPENPMAGVPSHITALLDRLHKESWEQESKMSWASMAGMADEEKTAVVRDKFIALDQDKSQYLYTLCRATGATTIVEAGTSFGVSTIYLALAAAANAKASGKTARVIATEHEPTKAAKAREYWRECGEAVTSVIDLREGDLRETLKQDLENVDLLLLDIWTPMVMPTVNVVQPKMRHGAVIIADNTKDAKGYDAFFDHTRAADSPFINMTLPFNRGLEMSVYLPK